MPDASAREGRWTLDTSRWPVAIMRVTGGDGRSAPDEASIYEVADTLLGVSERRVIVLDLTRASPDAKRRQRVFEWGKTQLDAIKSVTVAFAVVAPGAVQRGVITAAKWFVEMPVDIEVFAALPPAIEWAERRAATEGLSGPVPEALKGYTG